MLTRKRSLPKAPALGEESIQVRKRPQVFQSPSASASASVALASDVCAHGDHGIGYGTSNIRIDKSGRLLLAIRLC